MTARIAMRVAAALAIAAASCHATAGHVPGAARTQVVRPGEVVERMVLTGTLYPTNAVYLAVPPTDESELVIRWLVADGTPVKAGDRVLEFDGAPFAGKLADSHTLLATTEAQFRVTQSGNAAQLADKQAAVRQREIERDRAKLRAELPPDLVTARVAQDAALKLTQTEDELRKARSELAAATAELALEDRIKRIERDKIRRTNDAAQQAIGALIVVAPRDGTVVIEERPEDGRKYRVGDSVQQGNAIVSLPDLTKPMAVRADLIDVDDGRVELHMAGSCTLDAYPADPMACTVAELAPVARSKSGRDALRRAFEVALALGPADPAHLRPGMSVKIELDRRDSGSRTAGSLVVPRGAVLHGDGHDRVRLDSGELRDVSLGACDAQRCAIASGLADGDGVSIGGPS